MHRHIQTMNVHINKMSPQKSPYNQPPAGPVLLLSLVLWIDWTNVVEKYVLRATRVMISQSLSAEQPFEPPHEISNNLTMTSVDSDEPLQPPFKL